jgi:sulfate adenylyltransferase subunit 2
MSSLPLYLRELEAESIYIMREVKACFEKPVMMYSVGKDSSVLLHLARKAFYPAAVPFPLLHIDTGWKFREMISFRDKIARKFKLDLIVHTNEEGKRKGISPFSHGSSVYTDVMKTQALRQALDLYGFDAAIGGARRDEEASRAKERIFSVRNAGHVWDPRNQRPEIDMLFNTELGAGETMRVFPLSNWTELDVWEYIRAESIDVVPLYFAKLRRVVERAGLKLLLDDERMKIGKNEKVEKKSVRFRTLGCYPLTGALDSEARDIDALIKELRSSRFSERQGRAIDHDEAGSMEKKKQEGYF